MDEMLNKKGGHLKFDRKIEIQGAVIFHRVASL